MNVANKLLTLGVLMGGATLASAQPFNQTTLPAEIQVPAGNELAMITHAQGNITWICVNDGGKIGWKFAGPRAILSDIQGQAKISYFGPPATWESFDGSSITGKQLATSPSQSGSIPMQLVQANPSARVGELSGVTYIQRINLNGGKAPQQVCAQDMIGHTRVVKYSGDYLFWKAGTRPMTRTANPQEPSSGTTSPYMQKWW